MVDAPFAVEHEDVRADLVGVFHLGYLEHIVVDHLVHIHEREVVAARELLLYLDIEVVIVLGAHLEEC